MRRLAAVLLLAGLLSGAARADASSTPRAPARFEGRTIDLGDLDGWGPAHACVAGPSGIECYRSEAALEAQGAEPDAAVPRTAASKAASTCASPTRLYAGQKHGGNVLAIYNRYTWIDLKALGFDNQTSSFKIGSCAASMFDGKAGSGAKYPGRTGAGVQATSMASGWDNRISSVYLS